MRAAPTCQEDPLRRPHTQLGEVGIVTEKAEALFQADGTTGIEHVEGMLQEETRCLDLGLNLRQANLKVREHRHLFLAVHGELLAVGAAPGLVGSDRRTKEWSDEH